MAHAQPNVIGESLNWQSDSVCGWEAGRENWPDGPTQGFCLNWHLHMVNMFTDNTSVQDEDKGFPF